MSGELLLSSSLCFATVDLIFIKDVNRLITAAASVVICKSWVKLLTIILATMSKYRSKFAFVFSQLYDISYLLFPEKRKSVVFFCLMGFDNGHTMWLVYLSS